MPVFMFQVAQRIKGSVSSKQYGYEDLLCPLIAQACIDVCPKNPNNFNVDNVRVVKITGSGAYNSSVVKGIVIKRDTEGTIKSVTDAKVAVFAQGVDTSSTETKVSNEVSMLTVRVTGTGVTVATALTPSVRTPARAEWRWA